MVLEKNLGSWVINFRAMKFKGKRFSEGLRNLALRNKEKRKAKDRNQRNRIRYDHYEAIYRESVLSSSDLGVGNEAPQSITVSLTSFGVRIETVYLVVESLMSQSLKADRIILCLYRGEVAEATLPATLKRQRERGLEIYFCDEDIGSYKKYYYTLQKYPDDCIITVDDDLIYPIDTIDILYRAYQKEPDVIHCNRGHQMTLDSSGKLLPYWKWKTNHCASEATLDLFPTGHGGVLYFPGAFDSEVLNKDAFLKLAPHADDVWLKAMSLKKGTKCRQTLHSRDFRRRSTNILGANTTSLQQFNKHSHDGNDEAIRRCFRASGLGDWLQSGVIS